ncbi:MAG: alkaline phosphatase family protein, partial [Thermomicrobiales bacterium]
MSRGPHRLLSLLMVLTVLIAASGPALALQGATPEATPAGVTGARSGQPVIFFAADGMRPDLVEKYADAGLLPAFDDMLRNGVTGENGLLQAFPPNTGVGWSTLATGTWPGEHGSVNNSFYRTGDVSFGQATSGFDASILEAQTIAQAAQQAGKTVVSLEWSGTTGLDPALTGPTIDYRTTLSRPGVVTTAEVSSAQEARAEQLGVAYEPAALAEATDWTNVPRSYSPAFEQRIVAASTNLAVNPDRGYSLYIYDSTDDGTVNYDRALVVPEGVVSDEATPAASPVASPAASPVAAGQRDGSNAIGDIAVGDWMNVKVTLTGDRAGQTAGFHLKLMAMAGDLSSFGVYFTPIERTNAQYLAMGDEGSAAFEETLNATLPSVAVPDYAPLESGLIDEDTWAELGAMWQESHLAYLDYILSDLGVKPDLLMLGTSMTDEYSHQLLGLVTETDADGDPNPFFDDLNGDGTRDNRVEVREGYIQAAYQMADELLGKARDLMGDEANVFVTSDHGFAPAWYAVNAQLVLQNAGLSVAGCSIGPDVNLAAIQMKVCASGGTANIYLNLVDRDTPGLVTEDEYEGLRDQIVAAFEGLSDPDHPDATVVQQVFRKENLRDVQGTDALNIGRSGDVVVVLKAPYQFNSPAPDKVIAPSE